MENVRLASFKQPKDDISMQLKELLTNDMLIALFPNLHKLATICLCNRLSNHKLSLSNLIKIVIEFPEKLTESDLDEIVVMCGIEKVDGLLCKLSFRLLSHYICIFSLLLHFVKHFINIIMNINNTISEGEKWFQGGKPPPASLNETLSSKPHTPPTSQILHPISIFTTF